MLGRYEIQACLCLSMRISQNAHLQNKTNITDTLIGGVIRPLGPRNRHKKINKRLKYHALLYMM